MEQNSIERVKVDPEKSRREAQAAVLRQYTDEEIAALREEINVMEAGAQFTPPFNLRIVNENAYPDLNNEEILKKLIGRSKSDRLIDLGSSTTLSKNLSNFLTRDKYKKKVIESGAKEYIGVDLSPNEREWTITSDEPESKREVHLKYISKEILTACHSFPENYGNVWLTGIEGGRVIRKYERWGLALLSELKRIVPENGFIVTDHGFMDDIIRAVSADFEELEKCMQQNEEEKLKNWETQSDDPIFPNGALYKVKISEIGVDVYISKRESNFWDKPIVMINTNKLEKKR
jgi:hypothetical protein